jgi:peptide/nickel transport system substrate-binding protein
MGIPYAKWLSSGGKTGMEPPSSVSELKDAWNLYQRGLTLTDSQRIPVGKKIFMMHADQVWSIGIVGFGLTQYGLYYAKNNLGNVPKRMVNSTLMRTPSNGQPMTFYYKS